MLHEVPRSWPTSVERHLKELDVVCGELRAQVRELQRWRDEARRAGGNTLDPNEDRKRREFNKYGGLTDAQVEQMQRTVEAEREHRDRMAGNTDCMRGVSPAPALDASALPFTVVVKVPGGTSWIHFAEARLEPRPATHPEILMWEWIQNVVGAK